MSEEKHSTSHIVQSLAVNVLIAVIKLVAAILTGSGAMLAEALHSGADCGNQLLLLVGVKQAQKKPDADHPLGYGRAVYFWSFMVALLLFTGGGVFSIYEGIHKIVEPEKPERVWLGIVILVASLCLEGYACFSNVRELNKRRGAKGFFKYLVDTKDSDLVVVFGENSAAVLGLLLALAALLLAHFTGDGHWDGYGSVGIGVVLVGVAIFLAREVQSLLVGEAADPEIAKSAKSIVKGMPNLTKVLHIITLQQGPGEVVVAIKVAFAEGLTAEEVCATINDFEARLRSARPEARWVFVEPDIPRPGTPSSRPSAA